MTPPLAVNASGATLLPRFTREVIPALEAALARSLAVPAGLPGPVATAMEAATGVRGVAGSRWRPLLTLAAARAVGGSVAGAMPAAVAIELTHTASLVLDDLPSMDDAAERRGIEATHRMVGSGGAILVAISLLARAAELLGSHPREGGRLAARWGEAFGIAGMSGGQAVDLASSFRHGGAPRRLHRAKTTALSGLALEAGARVGGANPDTIEALSRFGVHVGWAYQLADDAQDWKEDGRISGVAIPAGPGSRSERLLVRAVNRLEKAPGLDRPGRVLLGALAHRAVRFPAAREGFRWG